MANLVFFFTPYFMSTTGQPGAVEFYFDGTIFYEDLAEMMQNRYWMKIFALMLKYSKFCFRWSFQIWTRDWEEMAEISEHVAWSNPSLLNSYKRQ